MDAHVAATFRSAVTAHGAFSRLLAELVHAPECRPRSRPERLRPGDVVGRYEILREVGRGGFGVVFQARDRRRGRCVALKTLRRGARSRAARESLKREAQAARLRHPNIVTVLEGGRCAWGPYVVLEYLSGETLADRIARGPLPLAETLAVAVAVARALAHAHRRGVLHRDLKPANVFLPSGSEAKLIDFGLARVSGRGGPRGSGTSRYMSPEQRNGAEEDARTDLFALGLLVHEMATGSSLLGHRGETCATMATPPGIPAELQRLVAALVERDPDRRPRTADEVLRELLAIADRRGAPGGGRS